MRIATTASLAVTRGDLHEPLLERREHDRGAGKKAGAMPLHKRGRGRADAHNEVERLLGVQRPKVFDERCLGIVVVRSGGDEGVVGDVERPGRLPLEFGTEDP